jgi:hypothetical protein
VRWVDAHDSVWWPDDGSKWVRERHGTEVVQAATALCALLGGPFMVFGGGEKQQEAWLSRLLDLRRSHPVLTSGTSTVERVDVSSSDVFPIYWWQADRWLLALINLSPNALAVEVRVPTAQDGLMDDLLDSTRGKVVLAQGAATVKLAPWASALLELERLS